MEAKRNPDESSIVRAGPAKLYILTEAPGASEEKPFNAGVNPVIYR